MTNEQEVLELAKRIYSEQTGFSMDSGHGSDIALADFSVAFAQAIRDQEASKVEQAIALYRAEAERIWALMPELRNTDVHYELFEAVHEKLRQLEAQIVRLSERLKTIVVSGELSAADTTKDQLYCEVKKSDIKSGRKALDKSQPTADAFVARIKAEAIEYAAEQLRKEMWEPFEVIARLQRVAAELRNAKEV